MHVFLALTFLLLFVVKCSNDNNQGNHNGQKKAVAEYDRTILLFTTVTLPAGTPLPTIDLTTIIDPGFNREKTQLGFYTDAQKQELTNRTLNELKEIWGYDFRAGMYHPVYGAYFLPGIGLFPYTRIGDPMFPINTDTKNPNRNGLWVLHQVGWIAVKNVFLPVDPCTVATGVGNYSGLKNLSVAYPGDLLEFGEHNFAHPELGINKTYTNPTDPKYREIVRIRALWSSRQTANGEGGSDTLGKLQCAQKSQDSQEGLYPKYNEISDQNGYLSSSVHRAKQLDGSTSYYGRASWTWPGRNQASVPQSTKRSSVNYDRIFSNPLTI